MKDESLHNKINRLLDGMAKVGTTSTVVPSQSLDHDLLIQLGTKVDQIQLDITELKRQSSNSPTRIEHTEVLRVQGDHESRVRLLETFKDNLMGKMIALGGVSGFVTGVIFLVVNHLWK